MEFSKKIYICNIVLVALVVVASFVAVFLSGTLCITDMTPITVASTSAFGSLAVANIFYYRKAQAENVVRMSKQIQDEQIELQNLETANQIMNSEFTAQ